MYDVEKMMEDAIAQYKETMKDNLQSQLEQQERMNTENGWETTDEDRQELIDDYNRQMEEYEVMMRQQMEMQKSMMENMGAIQGQVMAQQAQMGSLMPEMMEYDEEAQAAALAMFLEENKVPAEYKKYMPIGALLIGTQDEPYETLNLILDEEDASMILEGGWGIEDRDEALEMLESLLGGRHATAFEEDFKNAQAGNFDEMDEEDVEDYEASVEAIVSILELPQELVDNCETLYAWDLERIGYLARLFVKIGYISEAEAWEWMAKAAVKIKENFSTWEEYIVSVLLGRGFAMGVHQEPYAVALDLLTDSKAFLDENPIANLA